MLEFCAERGAHVIVEIAVSEPEWLDELRLIGETSPDGPKTRSERRLLAKMQRKRLRRR